MFHIGGSYQVTLAFRLAATVYNILETDYAVYLPFASGTTTAFAPAYSINQEGRRVLLSANVDF